MAEAEEEDLRQVALAVPVVHQTRAAVEEEVHPMKVVEEEEEVAVEGGLPK